MGIALRLDAEDTDEERSFMNSAVAGDLKTRKGSKQIEWAPPLGVVPTIQKNDLNEVAILFSLYLERAVDPLSRQSESAEQKSKPNGYCIPI